MAFAASTKTEDKTKAIFGRPRLIGMRHDARIEQRRCLERILVEKIGADELALDLGERDMIGQRIFHLRGTRLESLQQIAVTAEEVLHNVCQLTIGRPGIELEDSLDDMVGAGLIRWIEVAGLCRRFERPHDDARGIGSKMKGLTIEEGRLRQG